MYAHVIYTCTPLRSQHRGEAEQAGRQKRRNKQSLSALVL